MSTWSRLEETQPSAAPRPATREREEGNTMATSMREDLATGPTATGDLLLGHGAEFEGKLTFAGTLRIDATFKGSIATNDVLVVGQNARIDAEISCGTVIVYGEVNGSIEARNGIELRSPARVRGDIQTPSLTIEKGVVFQGRSRMVESQPGSPTKALAAEPPRRGPEESPGS